VGAFTRRRLEKLAARQRGAVHALTNRQPAVAEQELRLVAQGYEDLVGPEDQATLRARLDTAAAVNLQGRFSEALRELDQLMPICEAVLGTGDRTTLRARLPHVAALNGAGEFAAAAQAARSLADTLAPADALLPPDSTAEVLALETRSMLAHALNGQGRYSEAADVYGTVIEIRTRLGTPADPALLKARSDLAAALSAAGRTTEAVEQCRIVLDAALGNTERRSLGGQAAARNNYSRTLLQDKQYGEALTQARTATDLFTSLHGASHRNAMVPRINVANSLKGLGRYAQAEAEARAVTYAMAQALGADHPDTCLARIALGDALRHLGRLDEAESELASALDACSGKLGPEHPHTLLARVDIALLHAAQGIGDQELRDVLATCQQTLGPDHPHTRVARENLQQ
jgi:tetratricopeptide (TPR) repeat protein